MRLSVSQLQPLDQNDRSLDGIFQSPDGICQSKDRICHSPDDLCRLENGFVLLIFDHVRSPDDL
jgi:hypothetical protein